MIKARSSGSKVYLYFMKKGRQARHRIPRNSCFGFNGPLRQYFSLYRAVSQREGERQGLETAHLAYTYICGKPTESSEPYLMLTYISWFTALRKNVQFLRFSQFLSNNKGGGGGGGGFILGIHLHLGKTNRKQ